MSPRCNLILDNNLHFDGHVVKRVDFQYLGFYIDCKLSWVNHLTHVSNKINRGLGMLKRCCCCFFLVAIYYHCIMLLFFLSLHMV